MKLVAAILLTALCGTATAQNLNQQIATCAAKQGELDRLSCYDDLAKRNKLAGPQPAPTATPPGKWSVSDTTNPIDDSRTVVISVEADSPRTGLRRLKPDLVIRCSSNRTEAYISWHNFINTDGATVTTRIGDAAAIRNHWQTSTDHEATFFPGSPISVIKSMLGQRKFIAQVTPYSESPVTAIFDITGIEKAIEPLRKTCGW